MGVVLPQAHCRRACAARQQAHGDHLAKRYERRRQIAHRRRTRLVRQRSDTRHARPGYAAGDFRQRQSIRSGRRDDACAFLNFVPQAEACLTTRSPFVEALVEPIEGLRLIASLRRDDIDLQRIDRLNAANSLTRDYQPTTDRIGVVWSPAPRWNLYGSFTTAAEPVQQFVSITSAQGALSLQRGRQVEVGLKATTLGGDLDFNEAVAGATLVRDGNTPPNVPTWIANAFVRYEFAPRWTLSAGGRHVGRCYANNANLIDLDGFEVFDASIDFSSGRWTVGVRGRNLTDELYADWAIDQGLQQRVGDPRSAEAHLQVRW